MKDKRQLESSPADDIQNDEVIGKALKGSLLIGFGLVAVVGGGLVIRSLLGQKKEVNKRTEISLPAERRVDKLELPALPLTDVTGESGIDWVHVSGMAGDKLLPETMGGGVAVFDYDRDGDQDLLFVGGKSWDWSSEINRNPRSLCLYQNDGQGKFTDVSAEAGLNMSLYGMAPTVGDFNNDGWSDLYITAVGKNLLLRNNAGKFEDVTDAAGVAGLEDGWSSGATWFDYDNDGLLDLFVCDYVVWSRDLDLSIGFSLTGIGRAYGQPTSFTGTNSHLYHNDGGGIFSDVSEPMGIFIDNPNIKVPAGKGLCVAPIDIDHDGWTDLMVANDTVRNFLFINDQGKEFIESSIPMGVAFDRSGNATGAMGMDCGNLRNDDTLAIAVGNFANEPSSLFMSRGLEPQFIDLALSTGLGPVTRLNLTFGMFFADLDLDSRLDIVCSNGHLEAEIAKVQATQSYAQPPQFYWNAGPRADSEFVTMTAQQLGDAAVQPMVGRGAAFGDLDNDGDADVILIENSGKPRVLRNDQTLNHNWIRLHLEGSGKSNRSAYGAVVTLKAAGVTQRRFVTPTRSYLSQCETVVSFGLGSESKIDEIKVTWPDGTSQVFESFEINRLHKIVQP
jgi:enediyne biosynthesis protein E4